MIGNDGNVPFIFQDFRYEFEQNIREDLFLTVYISFMSEINSIPAILIIKISNKNFQPMIDHKKKKRKTEEKLLKSMKPVRFSDFHRSPFINGVSNGF